MRSALIVSLFVLVLTGCAASRPVALEQVRPGDAVRVRLLPPEHGVASYQLLRHVDGSIEVAADEGSEPRRIRLLELERLEVQRGRAVRRGATVGFTAGSLAGIVGGMICLAACPETERGKRILAPVAGFGIGFPIGILTGAVLAPPQWHDVRIR